MSNESDAPGTVRKKRFPARLDLKSPTTPKRLWETDYGKSNTTNTSTCKKEEGAGVSSPSEASRLTLQKQTFAAPLTSRGTDALRLRMAQRLYHLGLRHEGVLRAMSEVPRHIFVDDALANQAYEDTSLPIGLSQTISKPSVVARMIELIMPTDGRKLGRILDIGTGCGYQAAVLSHLVGEVYSIERLKGLHERARINLRPLRLKNVHLIYGDGILGFPTGAPYDAIIAAAGGDNIPTAWLEQLTVGGCIIAPVSSSGGAQSLIKVERTPQGWEQYELEAVQFVPLKPGIL